jgi:hypothetical protein
MTEVRKFLVVSVGPPLMLEWRIVQIRDVITGRRYGISSRYVKDPIPGEIISMLCEEFLHLPRKRVEHQQTISWKECGF